VSDAGSVSVAEAIRSRHSVRAFRPDPIPRETVTSLLALAARAPSGNNTQPWKVYVIEGRAKAALTAEVLHWREHEPRPPREYHYSPSPLPEPYRARSRQNGIALYRLLGIARGDEAAHHAQQRRNYAFFGAPLGLFVFVDRDLERGSWLDCGMFLQSLMLAARGHGLHTCPQACWASFHAVVRRHVGARASELLLCGVSLGYADETDPVNSLAVPRAPLEEFVRWVGGASERGEEEGE